jgi:hypothetical protein
MQGFVLLSLVVVVVLANASTNGKLMPIHGSHPTNILGEFVCVDPTVNCAGHGVCISNGTFNYACKCDPGYTNYNCATNVQCCYKQEKRIKSFLLSFLVGWSGAPYFVLGATGLGVGILLLCFGGCCLATCGKLWADTEMETCKPGCGSICASLSMILGGCGFVAAMIWWLVLWCMMAAETETIKDANNQPIAPW